MHRIDSTSAEAELNGAGKAGFRAGNPGLTGATAMTPDWCNAMQEEVANTIEGAGLLLDKANNAQLLAAVKLLAKSSSADNIEALKKLLGGEDLFSATETNGQLAGDNAYKADLNTFTTPGVYGVWNPSTSLSQIKGYWIVEVFASGEQIVQFCTSHLGNQLYYIRKRNGGTWTEERVVTETYLTASLATYLTSQSFSSAVRSIISAYNANPVGSAVLFTSESDSEALRMVDGLHVYLRANGQAFDTTSYPDLALRYPSGHVPTISDETVTHTGNGYDETSGQVESDWTETTGYYFIRALNA